MVPQKQSTRDMIIIGVCIAAYMGMLLLTNARLDAWGFPLDDAWIYQTYARNLGQLGEWSFIPGTPSAASTSLFWTPLLALGYVLPVDPIAWAHFLGLLILMAAALGASRLMHGTPFQAMVVGLAVGLELHMMWAAASGMETGLFTALAIWFWVWFFHNDPAERGYTAQGGLVLGMWGGVLLITRPEGMLLAGIAGLYGMLQPGEGRLIDRLRWGAMAGIGFALLFAPFAGLNLSISGEVLPSTSAAKQAEYAILRQQPYPVRWLQQAGVALVGAQVVALPALLYRIWQQAKARQWRWFLPLIWIAAHWAVYAALLPVTYQHGRYAIPTVGVLTAYSVQSLLDVIRLRSRRRWVRLGSQIWLGVLVVLLPLILVVFTIPTYENDVAFIEQDIVKTALWVEENVAEDAVIAAHDIGALGYYAPRPLVDLAGLVTPEVVPIINDGEALADFVVDRDADYLIVFPNWSPDYQILVADPRFCPVWSSAEQPGYDPELSGPFEPMTVYEVAPAGGCGDG